MFDCWQASRQRLVLSWGIRDTEHLTTLTSLGKLIWQYIIKHTEKNRFWNPLNVFSFCLKLNSYWRTWISVLTLSTFLAKFPENKTVNLTESYTPLMAYQFWLDFLILHTQYLGHQPNLPSTLKRYLCVFFRVFNLVRQSSSLLKNVIGEAVARQIFPKKRSL